MRRIVLASASPRRKELLEQIGASFEICPSNAEENIRKATPEKTVEALSECKAEEVFLRMDGEVLVIGADTFGCAGDRILGKPSSEEEAVQMREGLQGRTHTVYTGVTLLIRNKDGEVRKSFHEGTQVEFYPMSKEEIRDYVGTKEPMDKAGAYGIQGKSAIFIKKISGDYNNVVGLPLARLYQELKNMGIEIKEWQK